MTLGTVTSFNPANGFGFIALDDGGRLFVDFTATPDATVLRAGQRVAFQVASGAMGLHATHVHAVSPVPAVLP